mgnify:CR=1 FL=1
MAVTNGYELARTHSTFSGTDITVMIGGLNIGSAQALSYAVQREKAPLYVLGKVDPISFARGKRGIAGTMVNLLLEQHLLANALRSISYFIADGDEILADDEQRNVATANNNNLSRADNQSLDTQYAAADINGNYLSHAAWFIDQLLPQDVVLVAQNELGVQAQMRIYGLEFLNEGSGVGIDDRTIETQHTWIARTMMGWRKTAVWGGTGVIDQNTEPEPYNPSAST